MTTTRVPATKQEAIDLLMSDVEEWNRMREANPEWIPNLSGADLRGSDLRYADLRYADLNRAKVSRSQLAPYIGEPDWQE